MAFALISKPHFRHNPNCRLLYMLLFTLLLNVLIPDSLLLLAPPFAATCRSCDKHFVAPSAAYLFALVLGYVIMQL